MLNVHCAEENSLVETEADLHRNFGAQQQLHWSCGSSASVCLCVCLPSSGESFTRIEL